MKLAMHRKGLLFPALIVVLSLLVFEPASGNRFAHDITCVCQYSQFA